MLITTERQAKQRVVELVRQVKSKMNLQSPPEYMGVNDPTARFLGIAVEEGFLHLDDGLYDSSPPKIIIDPDKSDQERLNFTFFHEVTHHLIRQDGELYGFLDDHSPEHFDETKDMYCNIGAAEFLIPQFDVRQVIAQSGFTIDLIQQFDTVYPASKPAIAIQLAQCAPHQCIVVVCEYGQIPRHNRVQSGFGVRTGPAFSQLFVRYSSSSPTCKYTSGRFVAIPRDHLITDAYESQQPVRGEANIPFRSGTKWAVNCEATCYKGKVYAVFNISDPVPRNQLPLGI